MNNLKDPQPWRSVEDAVRLIFDTIVDETVEARKHPADQWFDGRIQGLISALYFLTREPHEQIRARAAKTADKRQAAKKAAEKRAGRRLCAHADLGGEGMHFLNPGEKCTYYEQRRQS